MAEQMIVADAIKPEKILHDLHELWDQLGRQQDTPGGLLRACAMTLVVAGDEDTGDGHEDVRRTLGVLMHDHPSRAIVVHAREGAEPSARVFAECWMPFGRYQQICAEGIELIADAWHMDDIARLLPPLLAPDLPVVLWCRGKSPFALPIFDPLFPLPEKSIFNSA